jgi:DNA-binding LacI/PurR family transcriptional regulator
MPTIRDVAQVAGVGIGTVSRVLSADPHVAAETRRRVQAAIDQLGYRSSPVARALRRGRSLTLDVLVPLFTRHFYVEVLRGLTAAVVDSDYALVIRTIERPGDRDRAFAACGAPGGADGVVIVSLTPPPGLLERLGTAQVPLVLVDSTDAGVVSVSVDYRAGAIAAMQHLLALGHRRIALIDRQADPFAFQDPGERRAGYRHALVAAGLPLIPAYEVVTDYSPEAGQAALGPLLSLPAPPTALLVGSDSQALGVLAAARESGVRVPEDLSVVGYNDIEIAPYLGLTTIRVPMAEMGRQGGERLLQQVERTGPPPGAVILPADLIVRATTGPAANR